MNIVYILYSTRKLSQNVQEESIKCHNWQSLIVQFMKSLRHNGIYAFQGDLKLLMRYNLFHSTLHIHSKHIINVCVCVCVSGVYVCAYGLQMNEAVRSSVPVS